MTGLIRISPDFTMPIEAATQTFLVVGKRGSGKSNTCARLAEQFFHVRVPFVVVDPVDNWWGLKSSRDGKGPGLPVYVFGGGHAEVPLEASSGALIADTIVEHRLSAVLSIKHLSGRERGRFVGDLAHRLFQRNTEPLHVFLEEAHEVAPQNPYKGEEEMLGHVARIWKLGRSSGLGGSAITQRPASLSKNVTTQAEILIVHRMIGPQDVAAIREWIRYHGEREDILAELSTLKTGEAFIWAPDFPEGKPIGLKRVTMLQRETYDSAATPKAGERRTEPKELAPVDLERLRNNMAASLEKAKADDPREQRKLVAERDRQIAELKAQLERAPAAAKERRIEVPVLKDQQLRRLEAALNGGQRMTDVATAQVELWTKAAGLYAEATAALRRAIEAQLPAVLTSTRSSPAAAIAGLATAPAVPPLPTSAHAASAPPEGLTKMLHAMLTALAQHPDGLTKRKIRIYTGYSDSGPVSKAFATMAASSWTQTLPDTRVRLTPAGHAALGPFEPLPTGKALREKVLTEPGRSEMERRFLALLFESYPEPMTKGELRAKAGYADSGPVSSTFGYLVGRDWAVAVGKGLLRAADEFFV